MSHSLIMLIAILVGFSPAYRAQLQSERKTENIVVASWYNHDGTIMANGKRFDRHNKTLVAHKSLKFGTRVVFTNPETSQTLETIVSDRGPYIKGRDFDLSEAGAKALGFKKRGVAKLYAHIKG